LREKSRKGRKQCDKERAIFDDTGEKKNGLPKEKKARMMAAHNAKKAHSPALKLDGPDQLATGEKETDAFLQRRRGGRLFP